jgi:ferritin-like metal-binding protein YciE
MAVTAVARMKGATEAIPLLEAMLEEDDAKQWVETKVAHAIAELTASQSTGSFVTSD